MGGISKQDILNSLNQESIIDEEEIYNAIMNTEEGIYNAIMDTEDCTDHPIRITYNRGKDNDQMILVRIRQALSKKGYSISNANNWLGRLKKEGAIEI